MVINSRLSTELTEWIDDSDVLANLTMDTGVLADILNYPAYAGEIMTAFSNSVDFSFLAGGCIILILVIVGIFFKAQKPEEDPEFEAVKHKIESGED